MGRRICFLPFLFVFISNYTFAQDELETNYIVLWDGLESRNNWNIVSAGEQDRLNLSSEYKTEGQTSLKVKSEIDRGSEEGIALKKEKAFLNIERARSVILDIYNTGAPFDLALVLNIDGFHKSYTKKIARGLNENIIFELKPRNFNPPFRQDAIAQNILLMIYPGRDRLDPFYLDNIRIHLYGGTEFLPTVSPGIGDLVAEGYTPPEAGPGHLLLLPGWSPINVGESTPPIPEPKTLFLVGAGLTSILFLQKRKKKGH